MTHHTAATRYGVYLRPSPSFARLVAEAFEVLRRQFGLREAGSYPPHVTLVGSIAVGEHAGEQALIDAIDAVLADTPRVTVDNRGIVIRPWDGIGYDLGNGPESRPTDAVRQLAGSLMEAVAPLRVFPESDWDAALRRCDSAERYRPHLTLAGRELEGNTDLADEVRRFLVEAGFGGPMRFTADTVTLYRLHADSWQADYWRSMTWQVVRSWHLD